MITKMSKLLLLTTSIFALQIQAEDFNCKNEFKWLEETFSKNDAGYQYVIDQKGPLAFDVHDGLIKKKLSDNLKPSECTKLMADWIGFFRSGHWSINYIENNKTSENSNNTVSPKVSFGLEEFEDYLNNSKLHPYEGIWNSGSYKIGIKKTRDQFVGFIISSTNESWSEKQIKLTIHSENKATYYMGDHSPVEIKNISAIGDNFISLGFISLERDVAIDNSPEDMKRYIKALSVDNSYFEIINEDTAYIRIPSFGGEYRQEIAKLIKKNRDIIISKDNLIIDIRNNGGGSDSSYNPLLEFLYTNPIRTVGVEFLSTELNNQRMIDFIEKDSWNFDEAGKKWAKESYDKLSKRLGQWVSLNENDVTTVTYDSVLSKPNNIAVLINEGVGSTSEQFLLAAKQSRKVKLFGKRTAGVVDVGNLYSTRSDSGYYQLSYALSKSKRMPDNVVDERGISPDYYMDKSIKPYEWIDFALGIFK